jgi:hypothetical protein
MKEARIQISEPSTSRAEREPKTQRSTSPDKPSSRAPKAKELPAFKGKKQSIDRASEVAAQANSPSAASAQKRIEIDFENDGSSVPTTVIVRKPIDFNDALEKSSNEAEQIRVRSRAVISAPPGDLSELPTAQAEAAAAQQAEATGVTAKTESTTIKNSATALPAKSEVTATTENQITVQADRAESPLSSQTKSTLPDALPSTRLSTDAALEEAEFRSQQGNRLREALRRSWRRPDPEAALAPNLELEKASNVETQIETPTSVTSTPPPTAPTPDATSTLVTETATTAKTTESAQIRAQTPVTGPRGQWALGDRRSVSVRGGALRAQWSQFDARMRNGATSFGLGLAQELMSPWGSLEARASFDLYHAIDQAVTIDNLRMISTRTEVAYWLTHSRVRPALTLGMGLTEYAVRSYRAVGDNGDVTLRTHARGTAFTIIPGTALRVDLNEDFRFDLQTEYLLHLGGDQSSRSQGLQVIGALGWTL